MNQPRSLVLTALGLASFAFTAAPESALAQDHSPTRAAERAWPDYRGPSFDGHAAAARVPLTWSEDKNVVWKTPVPGVGWSSPVVFGNQVWLTSASETGHEMSVLAFDASSGELLFTQTLFQNEKPEPKNKLNSYASPSPTIERGRVYVHFGTYGTACLDTASFKTVWQRRDIHCDHMEGPGSSPLLYRDLLIVHMDGGDTQYVIALDTENGETRWKTARSIDMSRQRPDLRKAYSTPVIVEVDGKPRLLSSAAGGTTAYDPETGKELWQVRHTGFSMSARPIVDQGMVFLNTGFMSARLLAVRLGGAGDVTDENIAWTYRRSVPRMSSCIAVDGHIYMVSDTGVATCLEAASGTEIFKQRLEADFCASPIYANGHVFLCDRDGNTRVLKPGKKFEVVATNKLDAGFMASPAVVGDALILRTETHLYRIESPDTASTAPSGSASSQAKKSSR